MSTPQIKSLTDRELSLLLAHTTDRAERARCTGTVRPIIDEMLVLLLAEAGLRAHEVCALTVGDVLAHDGRTGIIVRDDRGVTLRTVEVPGHVDKALARFVRFHRKGAQPSDPLVLSERGTPFSYMSLYSKVRRIGKDAGLAGLNPGMLRFAFLRRLYEKEKDLRYVREQAGHACLKTTARCIRALNRPEADSQESPPRPGPLCECCERPVPDGQGIRIDSGQLLCPDCLRELRGVQS